MSQVNPSPSPGAFDQLLQQWPRDHRMLDVRLVSLDDREVLQMRVDLGMLQMELDARPDGQRPFGAPTLLEHLVERQRLEGEHFVMDESLCNDVDREFMQFYHRRISWLRLERYFEAERDANHTLALMDFCLNHSLDMAWKAAHEHYRPLVMFHRAQAATLSEMQRNGVDSAVVTLDSHIKLLQHVMAERGATMDSEDEMLVQLDRLRTSLLQDFTLRDELQAELRNAVEEERFEDAARIRDAIYELDELDELDDSPS